MHHLCIHGVSRIPERLFHNSLLHRTKVMIFDLLLPRREDVWTHDLKQNLSGRRLCVFLIGTEAFADDFVVQSDLGQEAHSWVLCVFVEFVFIYWNSLEELTSNLAKQ